MLSEQKYDDYILILKKGEINSTDWDALSSLFSAPKDTTEIKITYKKIEFK